MSDTHDGANGGGEVLSVLLVAAQFKGGVKMKNMIDNQSPSVTRKYFEKGFGDKAACLLFVYRLGTDRAKSLNRVQTGVM